MTNQCGNATCAFAQPVRAAQRGAGVQEGPMKPAGPPIRGFTLAEMLIALALMGLLMVAAALAIQAASTSHAYNLEKAGLVARTRGVLDRIARDVRRSSGFEVIDAHTLNIMLPDGTTRTYGWNGSANGTVAYTEMNVAGSTSTPVSLTDRVQAFDITDATPACQVRLLLSGNFATSQITITATPRKALF